VARVKSFSCSITQQLADAVRTARAHAIAIAPRNLRAIVCARTAGVDFSSSRWHGASKAVHARERRERAL
jgi:hypothetical protein